MKQVALKDMAGKEELLSEVEGNIGWVTLNRPKALNALSLNMIRKLAHLLKEWEKSASVKAILVQGAGEKAFCAGGDVRAVYEAKKQGDLKTCEALFREEYTLNAHTHQYTKPYVALINGIAMGGGLGVAANGSHRIVTERALLAMPETGIGFFPDVGATTFLNRAPGSVGLYLGLTGFHLKAEDALWTGLATHFMPSSSLEAFTRALREGMELEPALTLYSCPLEGKGFLEHHYEEIETHFNKPSLRNILESLANDPSPFSQNTYNTLMTKSPTSLEVVFRQLKKEGPPLSFIERMKLEFRLSQHFMEGHDFMEGVRAVLVDKDHLPRWRPSTLQDLNPLDIDHYFVSLGKKELVL